MHRLTLGSYSLEIKTFREASEPRTTANPASGEYTALGATVVKGSAVAAKNIWVVQSWLTTAETDVLYVIYAESERKRLIQQDFSVTLEDYIRPYYEKSPRTRAIATGATSSTVTGDYLKYFAKYSVMFSKSPEVVERKSKLAVNFTLIELDPVPA